MNLISGKSETISRLPALAYSPRKLSKRPGPSQASAGELVIRSIDTRSPQRVHPDAGVSLLIGKKQGKNSISPREAIRSIAKNPSWSDTYTSDVAAFGSAQ
jgi:hypothetical protein